MAARDPRTCSCGREFAPRRANQKRCPECIASDPHRHGARAARSRGNEMFVCVDGEGRQVDSHTMLLISLSYGRQDGTRGSIYKDSGLTGQDVAQWMLDEGLDGPHTDPAGAQWRQALIGFHLKWDTAVIAKSFVDNLTIVHKANARHTNLLCNSHHQPWDDPCSKTHRADPEAQQAIITGGGEGDLLTVDTTTGIGIASTPTRRLYFELRPHIDRYDEHRRLDIHDVGSSFTGSLERNVDLWKPELEQGDRAIIAWGKQHRKTQFRGATRDQITAYSEAECIATARMARQLLDALRDSAHIEMKPSTLFGSGSVAAAIMIYYKVSKRKETARARRVLDNMGVDDIPHLTYFGGMIEAPVVGLVPGTVAEMDLCSAYPFAMTELPCMRDGHGHWETSELYLNFDGLPLATVGHVKVTWAVESGTMHPPFVVRRRDGCVAQPLSGAAWVTLVEYDAARRRWPSQIHAAAAAWWIQECGCRPPFWWLEDLYDARTGIKDRMTLLERGSPEWDSLNAQQEAIKLVINSVYGKLAQTRPEPGPFTNLHYASYITGRTRRAVRERSWLEIDRGNTVVYQHTDSVLTVGPVDPGKGSGDLGAWKREKDSLDMFIAQPGLAIATGGGKNATRGVTLDAFREAVDRYLDQVDLTTHPTTWPKLKVDRTMMLSRRMAIHRGKPELAGTFQSDPVELAVGGSKRDTGAARQIPGMTTAWEAPPVPYVPDPATLKDVQSFKNQLRNDWLAGLYEVGEWESIAIDFDDVPAQDAPK